MYGTTILTLEPMKIWAPSSAQMKTEKTKEKVKACMNSGEYFATLKIDGHWFAFKKVDGQCYLHSRRESVNGGYADKIDNIPHIKEVLERIPDNSMIIGEIYIPDGIASDVTKIMGCKPDKAISRQKESGYVYYYIHDVVFWNGEDLRDVGAYERQTVYLDRLFGRIGYQDYIKRANIVESNIEDFLYEEVFPAGGEGIVLTQYNAKYVSGRHAWTTLKIKKELSTEADLICTGFIEPTKEYNGDYLESHPYWEDDTPVSKNYYNGWVGGIKIGAYDNSGSLVELGSVSGITDETKQQIKESPESFIGRPLSISAMEIMFTEENDGLPSFRHPRFISWRDDISSKDCTLEKIAGRS